MQSIMILFMKHNNPKLDPWLFHSERLIIVYLPPNTVQKNCPYNKTIGQVEI